jgi:hypothetical protein
MDYLPAMNTSPAALMARAAWFTAFNLKRIAG